MMKTSKTNTISKPKTTPVTGKKAIKKNVISSKYVPSEDEIREKAMEIYYERISRGEHGTAEDDWHEAEELLRGS